MDNYTNLSSDGSQENKTKSDYINLEAGIKIQKKHKFIKNEDLIDILNKRKNSIEENRKEIRRKCLEIAEMDLNNEKTANINNSFTDDNFYFEESIVSIKNIHKTYLIGLEGVPALRGVNLKVKNGEFLVILGTSGGGKTSLLNIIGTIDQPSRVIFHC